MKTEKSKTPFWAKRRRRTIVEDPETGERYDLTEPSRGAGRECRGGCRLSGFSRVHGSAEEAFYCNKLFVLRKTGAIKDYRSQVGFDLSDRAGRRTGTHFVDFVVEHNDGSQEVREYKGFETVFWRLKAALFTFNYPEIPYSILKKQDLT